MEIKGHGAVKGNRMLLSNAVAGRQRARQESGVFKKWKGKKKKSQVICILLPWCGWIMEKTMTLRSHNHLRTLLEHNCVCVCVVYVSMRLLRRCECAHFLFVCCTHSQFYLLQYSTVYSTLTYTVKVCVCVCVLPCSCACCEYLSVWWIQTDLRWK